MAMTDPNNVPRVYPWECLKFIPWWRQFSGMEITQAMTASVIGSPLSWNPYSVQQGQILDHPLLFDPLNQFSRNINPKLYSLLLPCHCNNFWTICGKLPIQNCNTAKFARTQEGRWVYSGHAPCKETPVPVLHTCESPCTIQGNNYHRASDHFTNLVSHTSFMQA